MTKPIIRIHNTETDEIIDREMTNAEFLQYKKDVEDAEKQKTDLANKAAEKQAIADRLGLTLDELKLLLG